MDFQKTNIFETGQFMPLTQKVAYEHHTQEIDGYVKEQKWQIDQNKKRLSKIEHFCSNS